MRSGEREDAPSPMETSSTTPPRRKFCGEQEDKEEAETIVVKLDELEVVEKTEAEEMTDLEADQAESAGPAENWGTEPVGAGRPSQTTRTSSWTTSRRRTRTRSVMLT